MLLMSLNNIAMSFADRELFSDVNFEIAISRSLANCDFSNSP